MKLTYTKINKCLGIFHWKFIYYSNLYANRLQIQQMQSYAKM